MRHILAASLVLVLSAPAVAGNCAGSTATAAVHHAPALLDVATSDHRFSTLVTAVQAAGLTDALAGEGPFTIFAPTDEAFARIPPETLQALLLPENREALKAVLTFHVVPASVDSKAAAAAKHAPTLNGEAVDVRVAGRKLLVENAIVTQPDIEASNGIIHVIDTVMLPDGLSI
jgi:uncharacterized surface protein with fasciclin (FAS1) repeats